ncbi:DinB family protein [Ectobacillus antri]|jgi:uncharacterized damage-inducible protein DinB|uniref:DinB family protein n=1 Tax=Ectobacillus antri TaxID=2486280 RepID=A0ABT6H5E8_9BACI|nr:DinB family protein [Ectobacillus antri]MDG4658088.1 DinB family protein [Ectobacillus antri]MDG5753671.1 DinB family protein [Ectobacillus antri]
MNRASQFIHNFLTHRNVTIDLINKIEQGNYDFKPTETSMTAEQLVTHMLTSFYKFAAVVKAGDVSPLMAPIEDTETNLVKLADKYTSETISLLESLTEEDFDRVIDLTRVFGANLPGAHVLQMAYEHEIHHKGNLFVYVRAMGHTELPLFVKRG